MAEQNQAQLNYELAVYRQQIQMIKKETERIGLTTVDLNNALATVKSFKEDKMFVPIGGGTMIKGKIDDLKVLMPIGAQYMVEMEKDQAEKELEKRIEATKKAVEKLTQEFNKIAVKLKDVSAQLQQISSQSRLSDQVDQNIREDYI